MVIIMVVLAVVAAAGYGCYTVLSRTIFSPNTLVNEYLAAVASGNYQRATQLAEPRLQANKRAMLADKVGRAESSRISEPRVVSIRPRSDETLAVDISYELNGETCSDEIILAPDGSRYVVFDNWKIIRPLLKQVSFSAPKGQDDYLVNDVKLNAEQAETTGHVVDDRTLTFTAYPGTYVVKADVGRYFNTSTVTIRTNENTLLFDREIDVEPNADLEAAISKEMRSALNECATMKTLRSEACPFGFTPIYWSGEDPAISNISWSMDFYPTIDNVGIDGTYSTRYDGRVKRTFEAPDDFNKGIRRMWTGYETFSVEGKYTVDGDRVVVEMNTYGSYF